MLLSVTTTTKLLLNDHHMNHTTLTSQSFGRAWKRFRLAVHVLRAGETAVAALPAPPIVERPLVLPASIELLPDPDQAIDLILIAGTVDAFVSWELEKVSRASVASGIHVDLHRAHIPDAATMTLLERSIDRIEARGLSVRVAGIDPMHPSLAA